MEALDDDSHLRSLLSIFIRPLVQFQPAFDEHRSPLREVLLHHFGGAPPSFAVDEGRFFTILAFLGSESPIDGKTDFRNGLIARDALEFDVPREISH